MIFDDSIPKLRRGTVGTGMDIRDRLSASSHWVGECRVWTRAVTAHGYGNIAIDRRNWGAHRLSYETHVGPVPQGKVLDHLCRNRRCINPAHLEAVDQRENLLRGETLPAAQITRTHCPFGHPYSAGNLYICAAGQRHCKTCNRDRSRQRYRAMRAESIAA